MTMEVDHFNPTLPEATRHRYTNLYPAVRQCNNSKRRNWPTARQIALGIRFLDCCAEWDYGEHLFEDESTHRLYGTTPAGRYHIRMCDLNAPHFVRERRDRADLSTFLTSWPAIIRDLEKGLELSNLVQLLLGISNRMIPAIPYHP